MTAVAQSEVVLTTGAYTITGRRKLADRDAAADTPLVMALPGGTYTSVYFDVPGASAIKDRMMFGPPWTFAPGMPERSHVADAPVPRAELIDITHTWAERVRGLAAKVTVPVHYRQAQFDPLWITGDDQTAGFAAAFSSAPFVDARTFAGAGHCIDFHRLGLAFQLEQLEFALRCTVAPE